MDVWYMKYRTTHPAQYTDQRYNNNLPQKHNP